MRRKLFNLAAALSVLPLGLFLTSSVHWYSQAHSDSYSTFLYGSPTSHTSFAISNVFHVHHRTTAGDKNTRYASAGATLDWRAFGFSFRLMRLANYARLLYPRAATNPAVQWGPVLDWDFDIPAWFCIGMSSILPAIWFKSFLRQRREDKLLRHICLSCGYDLRATPDRCPECGTATAFDKYDEARIRMTKSEIRIKLE